MQVHSSALPQLRVRLSLDCVQSGHWGPPQHTLSVQASTVLLVWETSHQWKGETFGKVNVTLSGWPTVHVYNNLTISSVTGSPEDWVWGGAGALSLQVWGESAKKRRKFSSESQEIEKWSFCISYTVDQTHSYCVHPSSEELWLQRSRLPIQGMSQQ